MFFLFFLTSRSSSFSSLTLLCIFFLPIHRTSSSSSSSCSNPIIFIVLFLKPYHPSLMESSRYSHNTGSGLNRHCVRCECNLYATLATAWTDNNADRRFFGCGNYKDLWRQVCNFFEWYDPSLNPRVKKIIIGLMRNLEEFKNIENELRTKYI
ncbi:hypothetical protein AAZX31_01G119000 [Glycine max]|nr:hypothetical protein JHK87_001604 [Glycine soja]KAG5069274.1 hypothetical protein JHK85_001651 [Glycine max]